MIFMLTVKSLSSRFRMGVHIYEPLITIDNFISELYVKVSSWKYFYPLYIIQMFMVW